MTSPTVEQFGFVNSRWGAGTAGSPVPQPHLWGLELGSNAPFRGLDGKLPSPILGLLILGGCVAICLFVANIRRSSLGQRMLAVRSNERAAAAVTEHLTFRPDPGRPEKHGFVEPARRTTAEDYQASLAATRDQWVLDED